MGVGRPSFRQFVFSPMTSFTHRPGTSFTLAARAVRTLGCNRDGVEDDDVQEQRVRWIGGDAEDADVSHHPVCFLPGLNFQNAYTYDAASNRTSLTAPDNSITTYGYDALNRLNGMANSWAGSFGFGYDALSRRTSLTRPNGVNTVTLARRLSKSQPY